MLLTTFLYDEYSREDWNTVFKCFEAMAIVVGQESPHSLLRISDKKDDTILLTRSTP